MEIHEIDNMSVKQTNIIYDCLKSERLGIPNKLFIDGYHYCFKNLLKKINFLIDIEVVIVMF